MKKIKLLVSLTLVVGIATHAQTLPDIDLPGTTPDSASTTITHGDLFTLTNYGAGKTIPAISLYTIDTTYTIAASSYVWYRRATTDDTWTVVTDTVFEAGYEYKQTITLSPNDGFHFDTINTAKIYVNLRKIDAGDIHYNTLPIVGTVLLQFDYSYGLLPATTTLHHIISDTPITDNRIYSILGQYLGTDIDRLPRGIYIQNGQKIVKRQ
ncbi:MAG: hypothetical protein ACI392_07425 [Paludibacteraceae bacterium]